MRIDAGGEGIPIKDARIVSVSIDKDGLGYIVQGTLPEGLADPIGGYSIDEKGEDNGREVEVPTESGTDVP